MNTTYQQAESIELVHSGADYFTRLIRLLDEAKETIHLQTYIYQDDDTGRLVAGALRRAAARGVKVWVMVDGYGSNDLPAAFAGDLQQAGIEFRFFKHLISFWQWRFGRTLHHKVVVADACQALVGGINIADKYRGSATETPWLDFAVYIRGEACRQLSLLCAEIFNHAYWQTHRQPKGKYTLLPAGNRTGAVCFRLNDWMRRRTEIYQSYTKGISSARHSLIMVASYFLPGRSVRRRLNAAVRRGVDVRILLTGPSDIELSRVAEQYLAEWLVRRGFRVFQWKHSVMHGKAILVDDQWASLGSYNVNRLSRFRSLELNADIADPGFVRQFRQYLDHLLLSQCVELTPENIPAFSSRWGRLKARIAYHFSVYLMRALFPERR